MIGCSELKKYSIDLFPELRPIIESKSDESRSTWESSSETGKGLEFYTLCGLLGAAKTLGHNVRIPDIYYEQPSLFYLRNVIPVHHGAQAGHEAAGGSIPLKSRFLAALTPKAEIQTGCVSLHVYREGHPFHSIAKCYLGNNYKERPDILLSECTSKEIEQQNDEIWFRFEQEGLALRGTLKIRNDIHIPLGSFQVEGQARMRVNGLVECSVSKSAQHANDQLHNYERIFEGLDTTNTLLVNGCKITGSSYGTTVIVDLAGETPSESQTKFGYQMSEFIRQITR